MVATPDNAFDQSAYLLGVPYLCEIGDKARLCADITGPEGTETLWFEVEKEYSLALTSDRLDAFVVALLPTAMLAGRDIVCEAPLSPKLLYQIRHYLIPSVSLNMEEFHSITISASLATDISQTEMAVGMGWTGGVDSSFTLMEHLYAEEPPFRVTHLVIANNGALEGSDNTSTLSFMVKKARTGIAREIGLKVVGVNTNFRSFFHEQFVSVIIYRLSAVALALQGMFSVYFLSSTYVNSQFGFDPKDNESYEMFLLPLLSTEKLTFYSSGGSYSRLQKLKLLSDDPLARKYLHPCIYATRSNCCQCEKCIKTMVGLYALGKLDHFRAVFDVDAFYKDKDRFIGMTIAKKHELPHFYEIVSLLKLNGLITEKAEFMAQIHTAASKVVASHMDQLSR